MHINILVHSHICIYVYTRVYIGYFRIQHMYIYELYIYIVLCIVSFHKYVCKYVNIYIYTYTHIYLHVNMNQCPAEIYALTPRCSDA